MSSRRVVAWSAGVLGAAVTGAVMSLVSYASRSARRDDGSGDPVGEAEHARESTVAADDGVPLSVLEVGPADGGSPEVTVVLVHGYSLDSRCWLFQRVELPELVDPRVRLVLYDQRGHGRSGRPARGGGTIEQLGADLDAVLRATAGSEPVVLVGHSMGGMTIMALAEQRPELFGPWVRAVALLASSAGQVGAQGLPRPWLSRHNPLTAVLGVLAGWQPGLVELVRRGGARVTRSMVRELAFGDRGVDAELVELTEEMISGTSVETVTGFLETIGAHDRRAALAALRSCEVLVLGGDADRLTPFTHSETMAAELPEAELVRAPGAGHMVILERAELVTARLTGLVRRVAGGTRASDSAEKVSGR
ncbi:alpha/beta fold hydrolase [Actinopolyspora mortivallis]|uniref:Alpha/beta hydrolase n=1 Tax=Actinopolyspora mortivallis TaxID=33906 RepID=A0A2T0GVG8_ACTMO|nr:alpha/beta hydrolase [Actinopolyspora mortivallis]PRW63109.1 alpha/beta hydrolase [Actinopolyspora mortivallis]